MSEIQENHKILVVEGDDMVQFYCPTCERSFTMKKIDVAPYWVDMEVDVIGNEYATHSGGWGGLVIGGMEIVQDE